MQECEVVRSRDTKLVYPK